MEKVIILEATSPTISTAQIMYFCPGCAMLGFIWIDVIWLNFVIHGPPQVDMYTRLFH